MERPRTTKTEKADCNPHERVQRWLVSNSGEFREDLRRIITKSHAKLLETGEHNGVQIPSHLFDLKSREPHEMPVCAFWTTWAKRRPIPLGFRIVKGSVRILESDYVDYDGQVRRIHHVFLEDLSSNIVVDHCPAQFVNRRRTDIARGDRWIALTARAPELLTTFQGPTGDLKLLVGDKRIIEAKLGLRYDSPPRS